MCHLSGTWGDFHVSLEWHVGGDFHVSLEWHVGGISMCHLSGTWGGFPCVT